MSTRWKARGRRGAAALVIGVLVAGASSGTALAAPGSGAGAGAGGGYSPWPNVAEIATPSGHPEVAQRQALGCTVVGLGVTGVAVASGAMAVAGSGGAGAAPAGAMVGEIVTYFGAGCTIGAFLANLFPVMWPSQPAAGVRGVGWQEMDVWDIGG